MIDKIISAIAVTLYNEFGENYKIYKDKVEQGLNEPCFFVSCLNPITELSLGCRYTRNHQFCIQYLNQKGSNSQRYDVTERFCRIFEVLNVDDIKIRGTSFSINDDGDVLSFFVNFNTAFYKIKKTEKMEKMEGRINGN